MTRVGLQLYLKNICGSWFLKNFINFSELLRETLLIYLTIKTIKSYFCSLESFLSKVLFHKSQVFVTFSRGKQREHWAKMGYILVLHWRLKMKLNSDSLTTSYLFVFKYSASSDVVWSFGDWYIHLQSILSVKKPVLNQKRLEL